MGQPAAKGTGEQRLDEGRQNGEDGLLSDVEDDVATGRRGSERASEVMEMRRESKVKRSASGKVATATAGVAVLPRR